MTINYYRKSTFILSTIFLIAVLCCNNLRAQIIENKVNDLAPTPLKFNAAYISASKIKKITIHIADKPDNMVINDKGLVECYEFDSLGNATRYCVTSIIKTEQKEIKVPAVYKRGRLIQRAYIDYEWAYTYDTLFTWLSYDKKANLIMKRINAGDFFNTFYYEYDSLNRIIKETHCKETNKNLDKHQFELGVQTVLSSETFEYVLQTKTQRKKKFYNDANKVYKEAVINFTDTLVEESYSFTVGYVRYTNTFKYDQTGKLIQRTAITNSNGDVNNTATYNYTPENNLEKESKFKNGTNTHDHNYIYDESQKTLKSILVRNHLGLSILIMKLEYEFF
jgi:hypothetical protein